MYLETELQDGMSVQIEQDDWSNPREDFSNVGEMICYHNRYTLGDGNLSNVYDPYNYDGWQGLLKGIKESEDVITSLPVYMYDHGGISLSTTPYTCCWDSGQIGFIVALKDNVKEIYGSEDVEIEKLEATMKEEVKTYNDYVQGQVFDVTVKEADKVVDSCGGFYGTDFKDNGVYQFVEQYSKELAKQL